MEHRPQGFGQHIRIIVPVGVEAEEAGLALQRVLEAAHAGRRQPRGLHRRLGREGVAHRADRGVGAVLDLSGASRLAQGQ